MQTFLYSLSVALLLSACHEKVNAPGLKEEVQNRKIVRITDSELIQKADEMGREIILEAEKTFFKQLSEAVEKKGVSGAISYCNMEANPITQSISKKFEISLRRVSIKNRNPQNYPNNDELEILDAYQYAIDNKLEIGENIQKLSSGDFMFTKPIFVKSLCLNCHGNVETNISQDNLKLISDLYPQDKALGYKEGDFRGMWVAVLSKKNVAKSISREKIK